MKRKSSLFDMDNKSFYKDLPPWAKLFLIFVKGDLFALLPATIILIILYFVSVRFGLLMTGVYLTVRFLGEMFYWFLHQFGERKYRPHDFGFKKLDNNAIYIVYQTFVTVGAVFGIGIVLFVLLYLY